LGDTFAVFSKFFSAAQCIALSLNVAVVWIAGGLG
jgi:hypothetical protein